MDQLSKKVIIAVVAILVVLSDMALRETADSSMLTTLAHLSYPFIFFLFLHLLNTAWRM